MIDIKTSKMFRGIAILMVIASHYAAAMFVEPVRPALRLFISTWGVYGVDIFFVLSGYGLVKAYEKNGIDGLFVVKRIINVYIPYLLIIGFFAILEKSVTTPTEIFHLLIGYDYWYIMVQLVLYILFIVSYKIGWFKEILLTIGVVVFCIILNNKGYSAFWFLSNGAFLIGVYAASLEKRFGEKVGEFIKKSNLAAIAFALTFVFGYIYSQNGELWAELVRSICFSLFSLFVIVSFPGGGFILPSIGRYSLYMYLLHLRLFWKFIYINEDWPYFKAASIAAVISLAIAVAVGFAIEWNLNQLLKHIRIGKKSN